jgi:hypothetical protein
MENPVCVSKVDNAVVIMAHAVAPFIVAEVQEKFIIHIPDLFHCRFSDKEAGA